jgi:ribosomal protein S18 acetylase RimI-like enzyme
MLDAVVEQMRRYGVVLAYYRLAEGAEISDRDAARIGARLVDTRINFRKDLESQVARESVASRAGSGRPVSENATALEIRSFRAQEVGPELIELARTAGRYSRFHVDPRIDPAVFEAIYDAWLIRSVRREIADEVFVGSVGGRDVALVTVSIAEHGASIGLLSVGDRVRGQGFGRALTEYVFKWTAAQGCRAVRVATQHANAPARALYAAVGCVAESQERTYHIWLD